MDRDIKKLRVGVIGCGRISVMHFVSITDMMEELLKNA